MPVHLLQLSKVNQLVFSTELSLQWMQAALRLKILQVLYREKEELRLSPLTYTVQRDANGLPITNFPLLRKVIGDPNPDYTGSLVNEVSFKKLALRIQLDAVQGVEVFNADWRTRQGVGNGKEAEKEQTGVYPRGYINSFYASSRRMAC